VPAPAIVSGYVATVRGLNRNIRLLFARVALGYFGVVGIAMLLSNLYLLRLGYGTAFIGLANGLMLLATGSLSLPVGELGHRFTNRLVMIIGAWLLAFAYSALALSWLLPTAARSAWVLALHFLVGVGLTPSYVNQAPFLAGWAKDEEQNHAFAVFGAVTFGCAFLGALVGGLLPGFFARLLGLAAADPIPYGLGVLVGGLMMVPAGAALLPTREPPSESGAAAASGTGQAVSPQAGLAEEQPPRRTIALLALVSLVSYAGTGAVGTFWNVFFDQSLHVSTTAIGALSAASNLLGIPAALAMPPIMARLGRPRTYALMLLGIALSTASLGLAWSAFSAAVSYLARSLALSGSLTAANVVQQTSVSARWRSLMSGAGSMARTVGQAITAFGGGYVIAAFGYRPLFLGAAASVTVAVVLLWTRFGRARGMVARATPAAAR
jgi:MFS family permease